jgi:hypothetical protein
MNQHTNESDANFAPRTRIYDTNVARMIIDQRYDHTYVLHRQRLRTHRIIAIASSRSHACAAIGASEFVVSIHASYRCMTFSMSHSVCIHARDSSSHACGSCTFVCACEREAVRVRS